MDDKNPNDPAKPSIPSIKLTALVKTINIKVVNIIPGKYEIELYPKSPYKLVILKSPKVINNKEAAIWIKIFFLGDRINISSLIPKKNKIINEETAK